MLPLVFHPYLKSVVWGGRRLERLGKSLPVGPIGESWEISAHPHHVSRVADGPHAGRPLTDLTREYPTQLGCTRFPWLVKLLDCNGLLSIQVHPDDTQAVRLCGEANGKSEAWVVLDAEPDARIYAGFRSGVSRAEVEIRLGDGTLAECLHELTPRPGDCIYLPAGTVHAVGGGIVLAEIQQSSDATFRLYDWNRPGLDGKPRPLHVRESLECIHWDAGPIEARSTTGQEFELLASCRHFRLERFRTTTSFRSPHMGRMSVWLVTDGIAQMHTARDVRRLERGSTVLIPAECGETTWEAVENATLLAVT